MADTLTSEIRASLSWVFKDALELSTVADISRLEYAETIPDGTAENQADKVWHDERVLSTGANEDLTLSALLSPLFGDTLTIALVKVKAILLVNAVTTAGENLVLGGAASQEWLGPFAAAGDKLVIPADSCLLVVNKGAGWNVTAGSADRLRVANSGTGDITYKIAILGTSA